MSLTDALVSRASEALDDKGPLWLAQGIEKARASVANRHLALDVERTEAELAGREVPPIHTVERFGLDQAVVALDAIERRSPAIVTFGRARAAAVLIHLASGDEGNARRLALASASSFEQRRQASAQSTADTIAATEARAKATEEVLDLLKEIGVGALKAALPLLLAAL